MSRYKITAVVVTAFLIVFIGSYILFIKRNPISGLNGFESTKNIEPQKIEQRKWKEFNFFDYPSQQPESLVNPLLLRVDESGNIYVFDFGDEFRVKRFDLSGEPTGISGKGKGKGPGEHVNPSDFDVENNGKVWICGESTAKITVFNSDGTLINTYETNPPPHRLAVLHSDTYAIAPQFSTQLEFHKEGKKIAGTEPIMKNPQRWWMVFESVIYSDGMGGVISLPVYFGLLIRYNMQGKIVYIRSLADPVSPPLGATAPSSDFVTIDRASLQTVTLSASITENEIHVLRRNYNSQPQNIIDVYSLREGDYIFSYEPPASLRDFKLIGDSLFVGLKDTTFTIWKRE